MIDFTGFILNGLITMQGGEAGDGLQKTAFTAIAERVSGEYLPEHTNNGDIRAIETCEVEPGIWVRAPHKGQWYADKRITTRDQIMPMIVWAGFAKRADIILRQLKEQIKRFGRYQNTHAYVNGELVKKPWWKVDIADPSHWMEYYRALYMAGRFKLLLPLMYPIATFTDIFILGGVVAIILKGQLDPDFAEDDNALTGLIQTQHSFQTPLSWLANKIYFKYRPIAGYTDESKTVALRTVVKVNGPLSALLWKHRRATGAPPIGELWKTILK